ncbi:MAG TPA: DUF2760 domain-containing protein [Anaeromyxobacteraceae bacterium]|nr:DUF2760 domain-containing protein [Anaeromyxobacteraceae bacterium]
MDAEIGLFERILLAFVAFFWVLADRRFAVELRQLRALGRASEASSPGASREEELWPPPPALIEKRPVPPSRPSEPQVAPRPLKPEAAQHAEAIAVLALLQREGRLVDFASESLEGFTDADIGAAARTVHAGCRKVLETYLKLEPVFRDEEGATVTVAQGFDPAAVRLTGNVVGSPPFHGSLRHHGWRVVSSSFPEPSGLDPRVLCPAEVEL